MLKSSARAVQQLLQQRNLLKRSPKRLLLKWLRELKKAQWHLLRTPKALAKKRAGNKLPLHFFFMVRFFLSSEIPKDIADYIHELAKQLPAGAKYTVPHNIDLTIKFLGDVPATKLDEIKQRLSAITFKPFRVMLNGIGVFTEDFIRVVWVGLTPSEKFEELHVMADDALEGLFPKEKRFQAHLTIARVKMVEDKDEFLKAVKKIAIEPKTFTVDKLVLFSSKLSPKGAMHEPVFEIKAQ